MRIACPHCQAIYEVASVEPGVVFLCSRCHREFGLDASRHAGPETPAETQPGLFDAPPTDPGQPEPTDTPDENPPLFLTQLAEDEDTETDPDAPEAPIVPQALHHAQETDADMPAPERRSPRLLAWLSTVVLIVAIGGFAYNFQAWSHNLWLRSLLLNLHMPITVHASDWRIPPGSVHGEWLKRDDGSSVLVIEGRVENRLHAKLATPYIQVTVYDAEHPDQTVKQQTLAITQPPAMAAIRHAPWTPPPQDDVPVAAAGSRGFMLVMDGLPPHAGAFTLSVVPSLFR